MSTIKKKVIVGITGSVIVDSSGNFPGYKRAYVNDDYIQGVIRGGGVPYILPVIEDRDVVKEYAKNIDVLIMSGGHDVNPLLWNEEPSKRLGEIFPERDTFDFMILEEMFALKKPILGICRGEQIINTYFGGSLHQDINSLDWATVKHNQERRPELGTHTIKIEKDSKLFKILQDDEMVVNSFHHMAVKDVAPGFKKVAESKDGVVEGIEKEGDEFVLGVQWHPEMMASSNLKMQELFNYLIDLGGKGE